MIINLFIYLIESVIILNILHYFYNYVYYRLTYFEWNRFYYIAIAIISLMIPLIKFPLLININPFIDNSVVYIDFINGKSIVNIESDNNSELYKFVFSNNAYFTLINFLLIIYVSGVLKSLFVFIKNYISLYKLINVQKNTIIYDKPYKIIKINSKTIAFSFMRYIFLNNSIDKLEEHERKQIIEHEKIHAKQLHSLDLLLFEILGIIFWFNPKMNKIKNTIKEIHEYIVDSLLSDNNNNYSELILKLSEKSKKMSVVSFFAKNQIFNRITLLAKPEPEKIRKIRFAIALPVLFILLLSYSFTITTINKSNSFLENKEFTMPVNKNCKVVSGYFVNKKSKQIYKDKQDNDTQFLISHPQITYMCEDTMDIYAVLDGYVCKIEYYDNWGIDEYNISIKHKNGYTSVYKGVWKVIVKKNNKVKKNQKIALTGDIRLYPTFGFQLLLNGKLINPSKYLN